MLKKPGCMPSTLIEQRHNSEQGAEGDAADDDVKDAIERNAQGPRGAKGDVGKVRQHSLRDQMEADRYLASREARAMPLLPQGSSLWRAQEPCGTALSRGRVSILILCV